MASRETALPLLDQLNSVGQPKIDLIRRFPHRFKSVARETFRLIAYGRWSNAKIGNVALGFCCVVLLPCLVVAPGLVISALVSGLFVGASASWAVMRSSSQGLSSPETLSRLASFQYDAEALTFVVHPNRTPDLVGGKSTRLLSAALGSLASAIVLIGRPIEVPTLRFVQPFVLVAVWIMPLTVAALLFNVRHQERWLARRLKRQIDSLVVSATYELRRVRQIDATASLIEAACKLLNISPSGDYRNAIARFMAGDAASLVLHPAHATSFLQAIDELARNDLSTLTELLPIHEELQVAILLAKAAAEDSRNPFLESQLEALTTQAASLGDLLGQRRWSDFRQSCLKSIEQFHALQEQARRRREPAAVLPAGSDPYRILGADRAMAISDVRRLRTRLALLYHPDAGEGFANSSKMAEINAAFDALVSERKQQ